MSSRTFKYEEVSNCYNQIKKIVGDKNQSDSIAGVLDKINTVMHDQVNSGYEDEDAVYGELGKQLLLDWDNTSSNFPNFITNFNNWSALIASAGNNYLEFESKISEYKGNHSLGATSEAGRTTAYTNDGYYATYTQDVVDTAALSVGSYRAYNGIGYFDTNMVALEEQRKTNAMWGFGIQTVSVVLSLIGLHGLGSAGSAAVNASDDLAGAAVNAAANGADDMATAAARLTAENMDDLIATMGKMTTKEQAAFVNKLVQDGVINSQDDLLRLFAGNEGTAKTVLGSSVYRSIVSAMANGSDDAARAAASAASAATGGVDEAATAAINNPSLRAKIASMSDSALAKALGLSDEVVDAITLDGGTVRDYVLHNLGDSKVISALSNAGTGATTGASSLLSVAKAKVATLSDGALIKVLGLSDDMVAEITMSGGTVKQYAMSLLGDTKVVQALAAVGSNEYIPLTLGAGGSYLGENFLEDVDFSNVSYTENPYASVLGE